MAANAEMTNLQINRILRNVIPYVSFNDLLRWRTVSKEFRQEINSSSRFLDCNIKIIKTWTAEFPPNLPNLALKWRRVTFDHFIIRGNKFMREVWPSASQTVVNVNLRNMKMVCDKVVEFLQGCPVLRDVSLEKLSFDTVVAVDHTGAGHNSVCPHNRAQRIIGRNQNQVQSLRRISIQEMAVIPLCILLYFEETTDGRLQEFEYKNCEWDFATRQQIRPDVNSITDIINTIIQKNQNLRSFNLEKVTSGLDLLGRFLSVDVPVGNPNYGFSKLKLIQPVPQANNNMSDIYLNFLERHLTIHDKLRELELDMYVDDGNLLRLEQMIPLMNRLTKLNITIRSQPGGPYAAAPITDLGQLSALNYLKTLSISDNSMNPRIDREAIWLMIPTSVKYLKMYIRASDEREEIERQKERTLDFFRGPSAANNMTKLTLLNGSLINDEIMQAIIGHMPKLVELSIEDSEVLTDAGITGWPDETIKILTKAGCYTPMSKNFEFDVSEAKRNVKELKHLRKLNLKGCHQLSDISAYSLTFPYLQEIDVSGWPKLTDVGFVWIGLRNPCLETIICKNNGRVSKFGVNDLISRGITRIVDIQISRNSSQRTFGNINYNMSPRFDKVVTVSQ